MGTVKGQKEIIMSKGTRTGIDFSEHELLVTKSEGLLVHHLKKPNTNTNNIKFINTNNIMAVTGDFGNWIFCREFHPSKDNMVSDYYWLEKLTIASSQEGEGYSSTETEKEIRNKLSDLDNPDVEDYLNEEQKAELKMYYEEILEEVDWEHGYTARAYGDIPNDLIDGEDVPFVKVIKPWLRIVFDGFDEICDRMKKIDDE